MKAFLRLRNRSLNRMKGVILPSIAHKKSSKAIKKSHSANGSTTGTSSPVSKPSSPSKTNLAFLSAKLVEALMRGPNRRVVLRNRRLLLSQHRRLSA